MNLNIEAKNVTQKTSILIASVYNEISINYNTIVLSHNMISIFYNLERLRRIITWSLCYIPMKKLLMNQLFLWIKYFGNIFPNWAKKLANVSNRLLQPLYYYKKMLSYKCTCQMLLYLTWAFKKNSCGYIMHYVIKKNEMRTFRVMEASLVG